MLNTKEIILRFKKVHGDKFDYSKTVYTGSIYKLIVTCPRHGNFLIQPRHHTDGRGCPKCPKQGKRTKTPEQFIAAARKIHGAEFDYSKMEYINTKTKVLVRCSKGHEVVVYPDNHLRGFGCKICAGKYKKTQDDFVKDALEVHQSKYTYKNVEYTGCFGKVNITCEKHGDFSQTPGSHLSGSGCPKCQAPCRSLKDFIYLASIVHKKRYAYENSVYIKSNLKVLITCKKHGDFSQNPASHLAGSGCPVCAGLAPYTPDSFAKKANKIHKNKYTYSKTIYVSPPKKLVITCSEHGDFQMTTNNHLAGKGCPACSYEAKTKTTQEFIMEATNLHNKFYSYEKSKYIHSDIKLIITCPKHGDFEVLPRGHLSGQRCPQCTQTISTQENKLRLAFPFFKGAIKDIIPPLHLDMYSKEHSLAIEVNGRYWHSERNGRFKDYHLNKTQKCLDKGITLLHFWEDEVDKKLPIITSMINAKLGKSEVIFARQTTLVTPSKPLVKEFLNTNHLQGNRGYNKVYGLEYNGELISIMTFGKTRFNKNFEWEILRLAGILNTSIVGGASKLLTAFIRDCKPKSLITYADRRYSEGSVYEKIGLNFSHNSKPSYFYAKHEKNISRYQAQKHKLPKLLGDKFDPNLSETQNMLNNNYVKVWDCGNKVFTKTF